VRLVLVRHGESDHALRDVIAGQQSCRGLSERGLKQAELLAHRFTTTDEVSECQALLCSPVLRARQTAEVLAGALPAGPNEEDCDLCELHPGAADGLSWEAYRATYGARNLLTSPTRPFAPGAESWEEFVQRVRATLERLVRRFAGQTVVAVTHAGFIVASVLVLFDIPRPGTRAHLDPGYTSLTEWRVEEARWQLVRFNDLSHLTDGDLYET
jgi:broad specificity phosphatase PhoE